MIHERFMLEQCCAVVLLFLCLSVDISSQNFCEMEQLQNIIGCHLK